jgi:hypothetical protein
MDSVLHFHSSEKVIALVERGGGSTCQQRREALNKAIKKGRGAVLLDLTDQQYFRLKAAC